jgi:hypothetical protein
MAYSSTIKLVTGDTSPELNFSLKDSNTAASGYTLDEENSDSWAPVAITGGTVKLRIREVGSTSITETVTCTITSGSGGTCAAVFSTSAFPSAGTYEGEIEFTNSAGKIQTVQDFIKFIVREDFD